MTLHEQQRWLTSQIRRNQALLAAPYILGETILEQARVDLVALQALAETVRAAATPLLRTTP